MADGAMKRISLDQATLDKAHKMLDRLIDMTEAARVEACNEGLEAARDRLDLVGAHLRMARSEAGPLDFGNGVRPRSGDK